MPPAAQSDLEQVWDYTCQRWSEDQADTCVREIQRVIELIADNPLIGRSCEEVRTGYRRHAAGSHTLYCRIDAGGDLIDVMRILHKHMDADRHLD